MFFLTVQSGKHAGKKVKLPLGDVIVGRDEAAKVRIASSEVSREHCRLHVSADQVRVFDLDSRNGTYHNGVPLDAPALLTPGDTLTVGPMTFRLEDGTTGSKKDSSAAPGRDAENRAKNKLSDDDIASLLSSDELGVVGASDTTIHGEDSAVISVIAPTPAPPPKAPRREYKSVAEEAQEIIRLHLESLQAADEEADRV